MRITGFQNRPHHGRVEVFYSGEWGTICDDSWDIADARVVCGQLRFPGVVRELLEHQVPPGIGKIWLDDVMCVGNETELSNCSHGDWATDACFHYEDAGVICERGTLSYAMFEPGLNQCALYSVYIWSMIFSLSTTRTR